MSSQLSTVLSSAPFGAEADGVDVVTITVTVLDSAGQPLAGRNVQLSASGLGSSVAQPVAPTDVNGVTSGMLSASIAGLKTITATVNPNGSAILLDQVAGAEFIRLAPQSRYVRVSGSDANGGASPLDAWASLGFALTQLTAGQTLYVGAGTYPESLVINAAGTAAAPLVVRADRTGRFTGDAGDVVVDAGGADHAFRFSAAQFVVLRGFTITGASALNGGAGVRVDSGSSDVFLVENRVHGNGRGILVDGSMRVSLESNRISNNSAVPGPGHGVVLSAATDCELLHNLIYNNGGFGIHLKDGGNSVSINFNSLYGNANDQLREDVAGSVATIENSIISEGLGDGISLADGSVVLETGNLVWGHVGVDLRRGTLPPPSPPSGSADPEFVDPDGADDVLGGSGGEDDEFVLALTSPGLDSSTRDASQVRLPFGGALTAFSSRADDVLDGSGADGASANLGFHAAVPQVVDMAPLGASEARLYFGVAGDVRLHERQRDSGAAWATDTFGPPMNSDIRWVVSGISPLPSAEEFVAVLTDDGSSTELFLRHWDGRLWSEEDAFLSVSTGIASADAAQRGFDMALEGTTGDVLFVHADGSANPLFRTFANGTWSADASVFSSGPGVGRVLWVELVARPGTDEIALVTLDDQSNLKALLWDGSAWEASAVPMVLDTSIAELRESQAFDAAFESLSGDLLVAWGYNTVIEETRYATRAASSGTWTVAQHNSTDAVGATFCLAADPTSDNIAAAVGEGLSGDDVVGMIWDGSTWTHGAEFSLSSPNDQRDLAVGWLGTTGDAVLVYNDEGTGGALDWAKWDSSWKIKADAVLPQLGDMALVSMRSVPGEDELKMALLDDLGALFLLSYDGSQWTIEEGAALSSALAAPSSAAKAFDFGFRP